MLAAEGQVHKRMRRVGTPAFSIQNMRAFVPVTFRKANELKEKWEKLIDQQHLNSTPEKSGARLDICHWISRATFDVIGVAGKCWEEIHIDIWLISRQASITTFLPSSMRRMSFSRHTKICLRLQYEERAACGIWQLYIYLGWNEYMSVAFLSCTPHLTEYSAATAQ